MAKIRIIDGEIYVNDKKLEQANGEINTDNIEPKEPEYKNEEARQLHKISEAFAKAAMSCERGDLALKAYALMEIHILLGELKEIKEGCESDE